MPCVCVGGEGGSGYLLKASHAKPLVVELTEKGPGTPGKNGRTVACYHVSARPWVRSPVLGKGLGLEAACSEVF